MQDPKRRKIMLACARLREAGPWLVAAMTVLSANWAASALQGSAAAMVSGAPVFSPGRALAIFLFVFFSVLFYWYRSRFFSPRTRYLTDADEPEKRRYLFLFLSALPDALANKGGIPEGLELGFAHIGSDLEAIRQAKNGKRIRQWSWEMPLRAIWHHAAILNKVVLVCSEKSLEQVHAFLNICLRYGRLKNQVSFLVLGCKDGRPHLHDPQTITRKEPFPPATFQTEGLEGLSFDSFDILTRAFHHALKELHVPAEDIMIDITGGKKPASVVGAAVTFNTKIKAQYVDTEGENKVRGYDVVLISADTGGLGI